MDYKGQRLAELLYIFIIPFIGAIAWIVGYLKQDFMITFFGWLFGLVMSMLLCVPDWPMFNRHPVEWLKEVPSSSRNNKKAEKAAKAPSVETVPEDVAQKSAEKKKTKKNKR